MSEEELVNAAISRLGGWAEHHGRKCPVSDNTLVMCQLQWETRDQAIASGRYLAKYLGWDLPRESMDCIVAYKVVKRESN